MKEPRTKWAKLQLDMEHSEALQDLNAPTLKILLYTLMQLRWEDTSRQSKKANWICSNKDEIKLQYTTFKKPPYRMGDKTITRAIDSLLAHGFISVKEQGGSCKGHSTTFSYCESWFTWKPGDDPVEIRTPYAKRGFQNISPQSP